MPHDARDVNAGKLRRQRIRAGSPQEVPNSPLASGRFLLYPPGALTTVLKNRAAGRDPALCGFCKCGGRPADRRLEAGSPADGATMLL
ncbi:MAG: hypothetical protein MZV70_60980 [Desulfobacterales bacterium]|nr:hypothetical protein [Desulfobacterales bacterium]